MKKHVIGSHGQGIKDVAPALGFQWRDTDPGGAIRDAARARWA